MSDKPNRTGGALRNATAIVGLGGGIGVGIAITATVVREGSIEQIEALARILGTSAGILAVVVFAGWRIARWLRIKGDMLVDRHIAFLDSAQKCNESNTECVRDIRDSQHAQERTSKRIEAHVAQQGVVQSEQKTVLTAVHMAIQQMAASK